MNILQLLAPFSVFVGQFFGVGVAFPYFLGHFCKSKLVNTLVKN
jgi:hypothetical protein